MTPPHPRDVPRIPWSLGRVNRFSQTVRVTVEEIELDGDKGGRGEVPSVRVTCARCSHEVEVYGTSDDSVTRGCVMLREECPRGESNFYVAQRA